MQGFVYNESWLFFDQPVYNWNGTNVFSNGFSSICWREDSSSQQINQIVSGLEVINDATERSVQFDSDYNEILRANE